MNTWGLFGTFLIAPSFCKPQLILTLDLCRDWIPKCLSYSRGGQHFLLWLWSHSQAVIKTFPGERILFLRQGCFWDKATGSPFSPWSLQEAALCHVFCLLINWDSLFFPLTHRYSIAGLERGSPAVSFK